MQRSEEKVHFSSTWFCVWFLLIGQVCSAVEWVDVIPGHTWKAKSWGQAVNTDRQKKNCVQCKQSPAHVLFMSSMSVPFNQRRWWWWRRCLCAPFAAHKRPAVLVLHLGCITKPPRHLLCFCGAALTQRKDIGVLLIGNADRCPVVQCIKQQVSWSKKAYWWLAYF